MAVLTNRLDTNEKQISAHDAILRGNGTTEPLPQVVALLAAQVSNLGATFAEYIKDRKDDSKTIRNYLVGGIILIALEFGAMMMWAGLQNSVGGELSTHQRHNIVEKAGHR